MAVQPTLIFTTYNSPQWLEKVLWGLECQDWPDFEVIIADDGSGEETRRCIERFQSESALRLKHVWQEDAGFRKTRILNKAIRASSGNYLVFTDGDCIPRRDFMRVHAEAARPGCFLSGGYFKLPMATSQAISREDIRTGRAFDIHWLRQQGLHALPWKAWKLAASGRTARWLNRLTPTIASWNGHNASGWREDILAANGFDERMQYGGEDRELGERLINAGLEPLQIRYSAICVHLDHARGYVSKTARALNDQIRAETATSGRTRTPAGFERLSTV